uniref:Uncharacterized protein n=1 Tax=Chromera velia CCMP2878 TaxID=1169474 RepID=A0A0G4FDB2_9ALVE|eukprot:Cvel_3229.t1-p1 / transcript=Cvel_3229.t1 / gene=Cvel_3229 / organism=Chromera_velia_CCMP2878 / gene_product=hypothetical protein / transcript_product=hypothetical protein / location=Cvel_scaffold126:71894-98654(+) / protein_length=2422 / sequence_SO=supercontig / SO=protein_coding / is_pseudo=false
MSLSPVPTEAVARPGVELLANLLTPFVDNCFLFFALVCRDFHQAYTRQKKKKTTSLGCVFEETETGSRSCRLNHLILCLKRDARHRGGKPPLQTLVKRRRDGDLRIPAASLIVLLLNEAHKTPHALCATKTVASFFDLPPAVLLLPHLKTPGDSCFSTVANSLTKFGLPGDLCELRQLVCDVGLAPSDVVEYIDEDISYAEAIRYIKRGEVRKFRRVLDRLRPIWTFPEEVFDSAGPGSKEWSRLYGLRSLARERVRNLHDALCRKAKEVGDGEGAAVQVALENALECACVETGRLENADLWEDLAGRWEERGGCAKRFLRTYVKKLQAIVLEEKGRRDVSSWEAFEKRRTFNRRTIGGQMGWGSSYYTTISAVLKIIELVCKETRFVEEDSDLDEVRWGLVRALVSVFPVDELKRNEKRLNDVMTTILGTWCRPSWGAASVAWLRAFVGVMGASNFFQIFSQALKGFATERLTEDRVRVCKYLAEVRAEAMGATDGLGGQKFFSGLRGVFSEWGDVDFLVSVCGLPWSFVLQRARLEASLFPQAVSAGASSEVLESTPAAVTATASDSEDEDESGEPVAKIGWLAWGLGDADEIWRWEMSGAGEGDRARRDPLASGWSVGEQKWLPCLYEFSVLHARRPIGSASDEDEDAAPLPHLHAPRYRGSWRGLAVVVSDDRLEALRPLWEHEMTPETLSSGHPVFNGEMEDSSFCSMVERVAAGGTVQDVLSRVCTHGVYTYEVQSTGYGDRFVGPTGCSVVWGNPSMDADPWKPIGSQLFKKRRWFETLGVLFTIGLLHRCSCLRLNGDSIEGLKRVASIEFSSKELRKGWGGKGRGRAGRQRGRRPKTLTRSRPFLARILREFLGPFVQATASAVAAAAEGNNTPREDAATEQKKVAEVERTPKQSRGEEENPSSFLDTTQREKGTEDEHEEDPTDMEDQGGEVHLGEERDDRREEEREEGPLQSQKPAKPGQVPETPRPEAWSSDKKMLVNGRDLPPGFHIGAAYKAASGAPEEEEEEGDYRNMWKEAMKATGSEKARVWMYGCQIFWDIYDVFEDAQTHADALVRVAGTPGAADELFDVTFEPDNPLRFFKRRSQQALDSPPDPLKIHLPVMKDIVEVEMQEELPLVVGTMRKYMAASRVLSDRLPLTTDVDESWEDPIQQFASNQEQYSKRVDEMASLSLQQKKMIGKRMHGRFLQVLCHLSSTGSSPGLEQDLEDWFFMAAAFDHKSFADICLEMNAKTKSSPDIQAITEDPEVRIDQLSEVATERARTVGALFWYHGILQNVSIKKEEADAEDDDETPTRDEAVGPLSVEKAYVYIRRKEAELPYSKRVFRLLFLSHLLRESKKEKKKGTGVWPGWLTGEIKEAHRLLMTQMGAETCNVEKSESTQRNLEKVVDALNANIGDQFAALESIENPQEAQDLEAWYVQWMQIPKDTVDNLSLGKAVVKGESAEAEEEEERGPEDWVDVLGKIKRSCVLEMLASSAENPEDMEELQNQDTDKVSQSGLRELFFPGSPVGDLEHWHKVYYDQLNKIPTEAKTEVQYQQTFLRLITDCEAAPHDPICRVLMGATRCAREKLLGREALGRPCHLEAIGRALSGGLREAQLVLIETDRLACLEGGQHLMGTTPVTPQEHLPVKEKVLRDAQEHSLLDRLMFLRMNNLDKHGAMSLPDTGQNSLEEPLALSFVDTGEHALDLLAHGWLFAPTMAFRSSVLSFTNLLISCENKDGTDREHYATENPSMIAIIHRTFSLYGLPPLEMSAEERQEDSGDFPAYYTDEALICHLVKLHDLATQDQRLGVKEEDQKKTAFSGEEKKGKTKRFVRWTEKDSEDAEEVWRSMKGVGATDFPAKGEWVKDMRMRQMLQMGERLSQLLRKLFSSPSFTYKFDPQTLQFERLPHFIQIRKTGERRDPTAVLARIQAALSEKETRTGGGEEGERERETDESAGIDDADAEARQGSMTPPALWSDLGDPPPDPKASVGGAGSFLMGGETSTLQLAPDSSMSPEKKKEKTEELCNGMWGTLDRQTGGWEAVDMEAVIANAKVAAENQSEAEAEEPPVKLPSKKPDKDPETEVEDLLEEPVEPVEEEGELQSTIAVGFLAHANECRKVDDKEATGCKWPFRGPHIWTGPYEKNVPSPTIYHWKAGARDGISMYSRTMYRRQTIKGDGKNPDKHYWTPKPDKVNNWNEITDDELLEGVKAYKGQISYDLENKRTNVDGFADENYFIVARPEEAEDAEPLRKATPEDANEIINPIKWWPVGKRKHHTGSWNPRFRWENAGLDILERGQGQEEGGTAEDAKMREQELSDEGKMPLEAWFVYIPERWNTKKLIAIEKEAGVGSIGDLLWIKEKFSEEYAGENQERHMEPGQTDEAFGESWRVRARDNEAQTESFRCNSNGGFGRCQGFMDDLLGVSEEIEARGGKG